MTALRTNDRARTHPKTRPAVCPLSAHNPRTAWPCPDDESTFFIALSKCIATHRKMQDITQMELAERLGISQQAMN
jgi:hypothetical protein